MERDTGKREAKNHAWGRPYHDSSTPDNVDVLKCKEGKQEIRAGNDKTNSGRLVEPDRFEERCRVVH